MIHPSSLGVPPMGNPSTTEPVKHDATETLSGVSDPGGEREQVGVERQYITRWELG